LVASPCILVCTIDFATGYCFGCGRTRDEIAGWLSYTDRQRAEIMSGLAGRLSTVERRPRRETKRRRMAREGASGTGEADTE
jgi:uncharacterized protein